MSASELAAAGWAILTFAIKNIFKHNAPATTTGAISDIAWKIMTPSAKRAIEG